MSSFDGSPPITYRPLAPPSKDLTGSPNVGASDIANDVALTFSAFSAQPAPSSSSQYNAKPTLQRPLHRLRNDEITAVRHQIPAVYEALVQYDSLYLNAEARMDAKEHELARCIEVGQEVLMQLHAVRQRCNEISDERDAAVEGRAAVERQLNSLRLSVKTMERTYEDHYRSSSTEAAHSSMQLQYELQQEREVSAALSAQVDAYKHDQEQMDDAVDHLKRRVASLEHQRSDLSRQLAHLTESNAAHEQQARDEVADLTACGSFVVAIGAAVDCNTVRAPSTLGELRQSLQDVLRRAAALKDQRAADEAARSNLEQALDTARAQTSHAEHEAESLRKSLVDLRRGCGQLEAELTRMKEERVESPRRVKMLEASIEAKDGTVLELQRTVTRLESDLNVKNQRVQKLEAHVKALEQDLKGTEAQADHASRAAEATHRARLAEQTVSQLQADIAAKQKRLEHLRELELQVQLEEQKARDWEMRCQDAKQQQKLLDDRFREQHREVEALSETLSAAQADLYEAQSHRDTMQSEVSKAADTIQRLEAEVKRLRSNASLATELKVAREENVSLRDALETIQRECADLKEELSQVALEEETTSTSMLGRLHTLEADLEAKSRKCSDLASSEKQARQALREHTIKEDQLKEVVEDQKRRMSEFLQNHVPSVMYYELEKDFHNLRQELQDVQRESTAAQETYETASKQRATLEGDLSIEKRKHEEILGILNEWDEKLKSMEGHHSAIAIRIGASQSSAGRRATAGSKLGSATSRPLFVDASAVGSDSPTPSQDHNHEHHPSSTFQFSAASRKMLDSFLDSIAEQRKLLRVLQERLRSRRSLPPDAILLAASPQTYAETLNRWCDVSVQQVESLVHQANKVAESKGAQAGHLQDEVTRSRSTIADLEQHVASLQHRVDQAAALEGTLGSDLSAARAKAQRLAEERSTLINELESERARRTKAEAFATQCERKLEDAHSDVAFESKSLASRCEHLKTQLETERSDHQSAMTKLFEELSILKQERVRHHNTTHDDYNAETKRRRAAEADRDALHHRLNEVEAAKEEVEDRAERYAVMLQTAREEVERVTETLNDVEASLQQDLQAAEEEAESLRTELTEAQSKLRVAEASIAKHALDKQQSKQSHVDDAVATQRLLELRREVETYEGRLEEAQHVISTLEHRCRLQSEEIDLITQTSESECRELSALRAANEALEERLRAVESDRDPLRQQLHSLLDLGNRTHSPSPPPSGRRRRGAGE